jgi:integrase
MVPIERVMEMHSDGPVPAGFPLTAASNGQWAKKFQGRRHHFGATSAGWRAALDKYTHDWPFILQGKLPPPMVLDGQPDPSTVVYVATRFIAREAKRLSRGQLDGGSLAEIRSVVEVAVTHLGPSKRVGHLLPSDFADLREALGFRWVREGEGEAARWKRTGVRVQPATLKRRIVHVRAMFRWAGPNGEKLVGAPAYGDEFKLVSDATVTKAQKASERKHGVKRWEVADIGRIFNALDEQLQAMFLLSINCGFTAADCAALPWAAVDLGGGWIDFARVKTGVERPRLKLWPETVEAMRHVEALKLSPAPGWAEFVVHQDRGDTGEVIGAPVKLADCVFITSRGRPWVIRRVKLDAHKLPTTESHQDSIALEFNKALVKLGLKRERVGFGAGRHTFESHALRCADKSLVDAVMGHTSGEMSERYDHALDEDREALAQAVRYRLLPDAKKRDELRPATGAAAGGLRLAQ